MPVRPKFDPESGVIGERTRARSRLSWIRTSAFVGGAEPTIDVGPVANHDGGGVSRDTGGGHDGVSQMDPTTATPHDQLMVILADRADSKVAGRPFITLILEEVEMRPQVDRAIREHPEQHARRVRQCAAQPTDLPGARGRNAATSSVGRSGSRAPWRTRK